MCILATGFFSSHKKMEVHIQTQPFQPKSQNKRSIFLLFFWNAFKPIYLFCPDCFYRFWTIPTSLDINRGILLIKWNSIAFIVDDITDTRQKLHQYQLQRQTMTRKKKLYTHIQSENISFRFRLKWHGYYIITIPLLWL